MLGNWRLLRLDSSMVAKLQSGCPRFSPGLPYFIRLGRAYSSRKAYSSEVPISLGDCNRAYVDCVSPREILCLWLLHDGSMSFVNAITSNCPVPEVSSSVATQRADWIYYKRIYFKRKESHFHTDKLPFEQFRRIGEGLS